MLRATISHALAKFQPDKIALRYANVRNWEVGNAPEATSAKYERHVRGPRLCYPLPSKPPPTR